MVKYISVDIEADGPCPGVASMLSLGAVNVSNTRQTFYGEFRPITQQYNEESLKFSGFTREQSMEFPPAVDQMRLFDTWLTNVAEGDRLVFVSDNAGFDWQFVNYYFHSFLGRNPFGHSSLSLTSLYKGYRQDMRASFKYMRKTKHDHNALNDAMGNAEAFAKLLRKMGEKI